jgi:NAD(P)-dependent dehydrogenase (short-subunit alcohol dehydrogenase family)
MPDHTHTKRRTALVTGANRGLGREVVRQLADQGYRTILTSRNAEAGEHAAAEMRDAGFDVLALTMDVTSPPSIEAAHRTLAEQELAVDILVNNAAIIVGERAGVLEASLEEYRETLETNLIGAIAVARTFVPPMVERCYGRVVNVSSMAGQLSTMRAYAPAYSVSKAALNAFTRQLAAATKASGVLVNCACPGWVRTDMGGSGAPLSVEEGADTIVWLATLPSGGPTGGFFSKRRQVDW